MIDPFSRSAEPPIEVGELFARAGQAGRECDGALQGSDRFCRVLSVTLAQGQQIVRLGEVVVDGQCLLERLHAKRRLSGPVARQREFVENARRTIVEVHVRLIVLGSRHVAVPRRVDVSKELPGPRRPRVELRRLAQVAKGSFQFVATAIGVAAHQIPDHRVGFERDGAAERLNCRGQVSGCHGGVATAYQVAMTGLAVRDDVAIDGGHPDEHDQAGQKALHPGDPSIYRAFTGCGNL